MKNNSFSSNTQSTESPRFSSTLASSTGTNLAPFEIEPASLPSRALAALIDYILVTAFFLVLSHLVANADLQFLVAFLGGSLYFTIFHSSFSNGQSIGKKAFGLRVVRLNQQANIALSPARAFYRYFAYLGIIILLAEIPPLFFRAQAIIADPMWTEIHMLFVLSYFLCNISLLLFSPGNRGLHDLFCGTIVIRSNSLPTGDTIQAFYRALQERHKQPPIAIFFETGLGIFVGAFLWYTGLNTPLEFTIISTYRYAAENKFPVRVVSVAKEAEDTLTISLLELENNTSDTEKTLAKEVGQFFQVTPLPKETKIKKLRFELYPNPAKSVENITKESSYVVDLSSLEVSDSPTAPSETARNQAPEIPNESRAFEKSESTTP